MSIDRGSVLPPYRQAAAILRARIAAGEIAPGGVLPSITSLMQEFGVARLTAQKTLHLLEDDGLARVVPGWGSYVVEDPAAALKALAARGERRLPGEEVPGA